jgi:hypothetical protein
MPVWVGQPRPTVLRLILGPSPARPPVRYNPQGRQCGCARAVSEQAIEERRARFKIDVRKFAAGSVVDRHVIFGDCYVLDKDSYFNLKEQIADHFKIHPPQVVMVGSGKLGFSIAHPKRYRSFGETSDLDIAIVSPHLFDRIWEEAFKTRGRFGYWPGEDDFSTYLARGWIRPDKLPPARKFQIADDWWKFFDSLAASGDFGRYKIRGGLYRDWIFLKGYQNLAVMGCKSDLETPTAEFGAVEPAQDAAAGVLVHPPAARGDASGEQNAAAIAPDVSPVDAVAAPEHAESENDAHAAAPETNYENNSNKPKA